MSNSSDIQSAIERAKAVAAKLTSQIPAGAPQKRPLESNDGPPSQKKFASVDDERNKMDK